MPYIVVKINYLLKIFKAPLLLTILNFVVVSIWRDKTCVSISIAVSANAGFYIL